MATKDDDPQVTATRKEHLKTVEAEKKARGGDQVQVTDGDQGAAAEQ